jgi:hypothetical protein
MRKEEKEQREKNLQELCMKMKAADTMNRNDPDPAVRRGAFDATLLRDFVEAQSAVKEIEKEIETQG